MARQTLKSLIPGKKSDKQNKKIDKQMICWRMRRPRRRGGGRGGQSMAYINFCWVTYDIFSLISYWNSRTVESILSTLCLGWNNLFPKCQKSIKSHFLLLKSRQWNTVGIFLWCNFLRKKRRRILYFLLIKQQLIVWDSREHKGVGGTRIYSWTCPWLIEYSWTSL